MIDFIFFPEFFFQETRKWKQDLQFYQWKKNEMSMTKIQMFVLTQKSLNVAPVAWVGQTILGETPG